MKQIQKLIQFHKIPKLELAEALGLTWYQFNQNIYEDEIEFDKNTSSLFSKYLNEEHGIIMKPELIQAYSRIPNEYSLGSHGVWNGREYIETKKGYEFDPRLSIQDLLARVGLPIVITTKELGLSYPRMLKSWLLDLEELQAVVDMVNELTGNNYHALDLVSRFIPIDKLRRL